MPNVGPIAGGTSVDPSFQYVEHTASDTVPIKYNGRIQRCRGIFVGTAGDLAVKNDLGNSVTFTNVAAGVIHPISTDYIYATNTDATGIVVVF